MANDVELGAGSLMALVKTRLTCHLSPFIQMQAEGLYSCLIDSAVPAGWILSTVHITVCLMYFRKSQAFGFTHSTVN